MIENRIHSLKRQHKAKMLFSYYLILCSCANKNRGFNSIRSVRGWNNNISEPLLPWKKPERVGNNQCVVSSAHVHTLRPGVLRVSALTGLTLPSDTFHTTNTTNQYWTCVSNRTAVYIRNTFEFSSRNGDYVRASRRSVFKGKEDEVSACLCAQFVFCMFCFFLCVYIYGLRSRKRFFGEPIKWNVVDTHVLVSVHIIQIHSHSICWTSFCERSLLCYTQIISVYCGLSFYLSVLLRISSYKLVDSNSENNNK